MKERLVITGMGAVTPIGTGVEKYWRNLLGGQCGVDTISRFDASSLPCKIAAEIRDFEPTDALPRQMTRYAAKFMQYAFVAGCEAVAQSGLDLEKEPYQTGICMGTAMGGVAEMGHAEKSLLQNRSARVSPHFVPMVIGNMAAAHLAITYGIKGPSLTVNTACSAGGDALMSAAFLIMSGQAEAVITMGGESIICASMVSSLAQARALSRRNENPARASRPFDRDRDGFVIGEGGGALVVEKESHAQKRGAKILAILSGFGNTLDAYHVTAPDPTGAGAARCMRIALEGAALDPCEIGYVNAHGTSTQLGDLAEAGALEQVFGNCPKPPAVSSTKGATGHLMGAGGLTELIACIMAINEGILPPTINLDNPDPEIDLDHVANVPRKASIEHAMSNSLGFGGQNSSIIVSRHNQ